MRYTFVHQHDATDCAAACIRKCIKEEVKMKKGMLMWICYILCLLMAGCMEPEVYSTRDITEYRKFEGHISKEKNDIFSGLKIFPTELNENMKQISYYYECGNYALDNNYLIYFECEWEDANFADEIGRLKDLSLTYGEQKKKLFMKRWDFDIRLMYLYMMKICLTWNMH